MKCRIISREEIPDKQWNAYVKASPQGAVYGQTWYLDAIYPNWSSVMVYEKDQWVAVMPIKIKSKWGIKYALQPKFAQHLGVFFKPSQNLIRKELSSQKKIINLIINTLQNKLKLFEFHFSPKFRYFLPFQNEGFKVHQRLTYELDTDTTIEKLYSCYSSRVTDHIKKAEKNDLTANRSFDIAPLLKLCRENQIIDSKDVTRLEKLWKELKARNMGFCYYVQDQEGTIHSGGAFIKYNGRLIFILLSTDTRYKNLGSTSLLIHNALKVAVMDPECHCFDFEGSMIRGVEHYFQAFNPEMVTYLKICKNKIPLITSLYSTARLILILSILSY